MEEKKFDLNSLIGFILIGGILVWMLYQNAPTQEEIDAENAKQEQIDKQKEEAKEAEETISLEEAPKPVAIENPQDSTAVAAAQGKLGAFAYALSLPSATESYTTLENDLVSLKISNYGGYLEEALLKSFVTYDSIPVYLIKDGNAILDLEFVSENRTLHSKDLPFEPTLTKNGDNQVLSMKLKISANQYLEYRYELKPGDYMMDFSVRTNGLENVLDTSNPAKLTWELQGYRHAKSISYENRYTELIWEYEDGKDDYLGQQSETDDASDEVTYVAYKQHFFTSILLSDKKIDNALFYSENLVEDEDIDTVYTKKFKTILPLAFEGGELDYSMDWYYGPSDFKILNAYDRNLDEVVPLGWGIFGWINRYLFIPLFGFLSGFLPYGIAIIVMTILVRIALSPVTYKSYLSQAKMKVLRPEITEINEKHKDNAMKRQQETMALYRKAGASPMAGCIPALLQLPVFYALFQFFPSAFELRQKGFLWAEDLSSYDTVIELGTRIPLYGDHISLFPILASVAIFFYMMMTTGQTMQTQQPGMPNMKVIMYISPLFMLVFFNNYASGLSLYYFISNLITIGIMLVIKNYIIDEDKIHAKIEQKKKNPKKQNRFQKRMSEMMEQAEAQKNAKKR
ncbi:MAG: membrane protein insertase YidC [Gilvibacter sp.]